jgi:hypothetical protein
MFGNYYYYNYYCYFGGNYSLAKGIVYAKYIWHELTFSHHLHVYNYWLHKQYFIHSVQVCVWCISLPNFNYSGSLLIAIKHIIHAPTILFSTKRVT